MLSASVVADGHNRLLPMMGEFVPPKQDAAASRPELPAESRKQDCERNAAQRWLPDHSEELRPYRPVFLGDDLYCCQSVCRAVLDAEADFIFVAKPNSHKRLHELLHDQFIHSQPWLHRRNRKRNFGHGSNGLANLLATLNLFAFALHGVLDCACELWRQCRERAATRRAFFEEPRVCTKYFCFPHGRALFETLRKQRLPPGWPLRGPPGPRDAAHRRDNVASGTVRTSIQAPKPLRRSQCHLPDSPK